MRLPGFETILRTHLRVGVRHWASAAQTEGLQCGAQTNAGKLAGAIVARIREKSRVSIDTVGPQAGYTALKSIMIAEEYAKQDFKDKVLVVRPEMVKLEPREAPSGRMTETNALRMHVAAADQFKEVQQELVYFSGDTNPGTAAGLLSRLVESKGCWIQKQSYHPLYHFTLYAFCQAWVLQLHPRFTRLSSSPRTTCEGTRAWAIR
ncbi:unnamed protein product [Durusdinium trenchii]|uniref:Uncharacterized protein n=1 Tax=Durusdinium trenchii TaxID=1381693 RepID=A0ABP0RDD4_9DINO